MGIKRRNPNAPEAKSRVVVLTAGGTGGHIFPAEALAEVLLARGYEPHLITDARFEDYRKHQVYGAFGNIKIHPIATARSGGSIKNSLLNMLVIAKGVRQSRAILKQLKPLAVVGFGGYPSLPAMMAAITRGECTVLQEQNSVLGRVNRALAPFVNAIALTYPNTQKLRCSAEGKSVHLGNPVRAQVKALGMLQYSSPASDALLRLLVVGGSQGASIFSKVVPAAIKALPEEVRRRIRIDQQCRPEDIDEVRRTYERLNLQADIQPFFNDMHMRLAGAHLVIARSGASTVSELCVAGRPAILVPLPHATDNHQYYNAQAVEDIGGGVVMPQEGFTPEALAARLETYVSLPASLEDASQKIRLLSRADAADALADLVLDVSGARAHDVKPQTPEPVMLKEAV